MSNTLTGQQLIERLNWRYATKQFDPARKISAQDWAAIEEALVLSASSYGVQPYKFFVITDPALRAKLRPVSYGQSQITDASHLVVFASRTNYTEADAEAFIKLTAQTRGIPEDALAQYKGMIIGGVVKGMDEHTRAAWMRCQTYIALGNLLTSAAVLGIDACPMEGFDRAQYDAILGLKEQGYASVVLATLGYRSPDDKYAGMAKVRFPKAKLVARL